MTDWTLHHGDCLEIMPTLPENSVDAIVTDPPYGLGFMGKHWDHGVPGVDFWREALRVAKPGAYLLAFGGTRTFHRMAVAIEDASWEIRDTVMWVYGSGFPKSHDVSKAIDREAGAVREDAIKGGHMGISINGGDPRDERASELHVFNQINKGALFRGTPATPDAAKWAGWGTALKPAYEPIIVARKPLHGTVAANVLEWGTGAINVDACRVGTEEIEQGRKGRTSPKFNGVTMNPYGGQDYEKPSAIGRWPANVIHDGSGEVLRLFPVTTSNARASKGVIGADLSNAIYEGGWKRGSTNAPNDTGSAARFFYCSKASKADRDEGLEGWALRVAGIGDVDESSGRDSSKPGNQYGEGSRRRVDAGLSPTMPRANHHPTVKPTSLMRYLCRLVTQPGGVILDPFMGSGSTGKAAMLEGFRFIGIEQDAEYIAIARARIEHAKMQAQGPLFAMAAD